LIICNNIFVEILIKVFKVTKMHLLVLPISGGGFVCQLAMIQQLCQINYIPDVTLASSGGNVAAYVAAAAEWKWAGIERVARNLTQDLFAKTWNSVAIISFIIGYFQGNVYRKGDGVTEFIAKYFDDKNIGKYEIWTGTYNKTRQKSCLFCNRSAEDSIFNMSSLDCELTRSMEPVFANYDFNLIAKASIASASIPAIVPAEIINGESYMDGGVAGASPLTIMQEPILNYVKSTQSPLHITYINPTDLSSSKLRPCNNVMDNWRQATKDIVTFHSVTDRLAGYDLIRTLSENVHQETFLCNYKNLTIIKKLRNYISYSMLEIYPLESISVNIVGFSGEEVVDAIHEAYNKCKCHFWWGECDDNPNTNIIQTLIATLNY
jgi:predicted acylesterase/phospholipase RssA